MNSNGRIFEFYKLGKNSLISAEIRPVQCLIESSSGHIKSTKWMNADHWLELETFIDNILRNYEEHRKSYFPSIQEDEEPDVLSGTLIKIGYSFKRNSKDHCSYLVPRQDALWDDKDSTTLTDKGGRYKKLGRCGYRLIVAVAPTTSSLCNSKNIDESLYAALDSKLHQKVSISSYFEKPSKLSRSKLTNSKSASQPDKSNLKPKAANSDCRTEPICSIFDTSSEESTTKIHDDSLHSNSPSPNNGRSRNGERSPYSLQRNNKWKRSRFLRPAKHSSDTENDLTTWGRANIESNLSSEFDAGRVRINSKNEICTQLDDVNYRNLNSQSLCFPGSDDMNTLAQDDESKNCDQSVVFLEQSDTSDKERELSPKANKERTKSKAGFGTKSMLLFESIDSTFLETDSQPDEEYDPNTPFISMSPLRSMELASKNVPSNNVSHSGGSSTTGFKEYEGSDGNLSYKPLVFLPGTNGEYGCPETLNEKAENSDAYQDQESDWDHSEILLKTIRKLKRSKKLRSPEIVSPESPQSDCYVSEEEIGTEMNKKDSMTAHKKICRSVPKAVGNSVLSKKRVRGTSSKEVGVPRKGSKDWKTYIRLQEMVRQLTTKTPVQLLLENDSSIDCSPAPSPTKDSLTQNGYSLSVKNNIKTSTKFDIRNFTISLPSSSNCSTEADFKCSSRRVKKRSKNSNDLSSSGSATEQPSGSNDPPKNAVALQKRKKRRKSLIDDATQPTLEQYLDRSGSKSIKESRLRPESASADGKPETQFREQLDSSPADQSIILDYSPADSSESSELSPEEKEELEFINKVIPYFEGLTKEEIDGHYEANLKHFLKLKRRKCHTERSRLYFSMQRKDIHPEIYVSFIESTNLNFILDKWTQCYTEENSDAVSFFFLVILPDFIHKIFYQIPVVKDHSTTFHDDELELILYKVALSMQQRKHKYLFL